MVFQTLLLMNAGKKFNLPLAYNENADRKSWEAMKTLFERVL